ncbi:hypothetical protein [Nocardia araoensis]|uniref:hypothetical protein n=1 Tax=Nocardia araoensis TaxID=228600 RepID=UPI0003177545|nr:hypothetical protein [Nocardia araoensis]
MAGYLQVDIDVLAKTVQSLRDAEQVLDDAMKALAKGGHGDIGTTALNDAADSFQRRWRFGIERIREAATTTAEGVSKCHDAYLSLDTSFAKALGQPEIPVDGQAPAGDQQSDAR